MLVLIDNYDSFTYNLVHYFQELGEKVRVFRNDGISSEEVLKLNPTSLEISPGPSTPMNSGICMNLIKLNSRQKKPIPTLGVCLGHQVIALANDIKTYKMFNGHRGINHPVLNLNTGKGEITSQNHGFAVDYKTAVSNKSVKISHQHLNDQTVAGLEIKGKDCFSVQYHPEASPGPHDSNYLFDEFVQMIIDNKK